MEEDGVPVHLQYNLPFGLAEAPDSFGVQASWIPAGTVKTIHRLRIEQIDQDSFRGASHGKQCLL